MFRYLHGVAAACGFILWLSAGAAAAGCGTTAGCGTDAVNKAGQPASAAHECGHQCASAVATEDVGTIKAIDAEKGEMVISSGGASEDITVVADKALMGKFKEGDSIQVEYETKCVNVATGMQKKRPGFKKPAPCTDKKL